MNEMWRPRVPVKLTFPQLEREIVSDGAQSIFHAARKHGVRIVGACGGRGTCGSCTVRVHHDSAADSRKWVRACQVTPDADCSIEIAPRSLAPVVRAEVEQSGEAEVLPLDAAVIGFDVTVPEAALTDTASDFDRVLRALPVAPTTTRVDLAALRELPAVLRDNRWSARVLVRGAEVTGFAAPGTRTLGLAVDLGTTNAAAFLIDLETGARLAHLGIENPQVAWGADLISRINAAIRSPETAEELRGAAVTTINALAHDLCHAIGAGSHDIADIAVCGNTAMQHLLLGLPVRQLGRAPFVGAVRDCQDVKARDAGLTAAPGACVHAAPGIGGFVGSDHVTALLATEARWRGAETALVMDIGTNTEISLVHRGQMMSASCPSGPALEGGHISCGMRAADGAIERVLLEDGRIRVATIGGKEAIGLCGSGVLDTLATLLKAGLINPGGRLTGDHPDIAVADGKRQAMLAPNVAFTQDDIRAVQLAKAAIRTGTEMLIREAGIEESAIERFIVAGAFGAYIDIASGVAIGLLPDLPPARFEQVGNAAGAGVRMMLASKAARCRAQQIAAEARYIELSTLPAFQKRFLHHIGFKA